MASTTDVIQAALGIASFVVAVWTLREARLQRLSNASPATTPEAPPGSSDAPESAQEPNVRPPSGPAARTPGPRPSPTSETPASGTWRLFSLRTYALLLIAFGTLALVRDQWLHSSTGRFLLALGILAGALALASTRFGKAISPAWRSQLATLGVAMSVAVTVAAIFPSRPRPTSTDPVGDLAFVAVGVGMLVCDWYLTRRKAHRAGR